MERMEKRTDFCDVIDKIQRQDKYIEYIEEENKKLREENETQKNLNLGERTEYLKCIEELKEENGKLGKENEELKDTMKELNNYNKFRIQENERLKKENEELQEYKSMYEGLC